MPKIADVIASKNMSYTAGTGKFADIGVYGEGYAPANIGPQAYVSTYSVPGDLIYVALNGTGSASTIGAPSSWATGISQAGPGDKIVMRGGEYAFTGSMLISCSGSSGLPVIIEPYQGETVVINGVSVTAGTDNYLDLTGNFVWIRGIEIKNMPGQGLRIVGADNKIENCYIHHCNLSGIHIQNPADNNLMSTTAQSRNLIKNCIIEYCSDVGFTGSGRNNGENADGISITQGYDNVIENTICRYNSDDGIDAWKSVRAVIRNCISHNNGPTTAGEHNGDGNGFKLGGPSPSTGTIIQHCISHSNFARGFDSNGAADVNISYCTSFNESPGYNPASDTEITKCIAESVDKVYGGAGVGVQTLNSWNRTGVPSFVSTEPSSDGFLVPVYEDLAYPKVQNLLQFRFVRNFSGTASNPSARCIRVNNTDYAAVTEIYISNRNKNSVYVDDYLLEAKNGNIVRLLTSRDKYIIFKLSADAANMTGWVKFTGTVVIQSGGFHEFEIMTMEF